MQEAGSHSMATRKRTVITEETHEVWIIRRSDDLEQSPPSPDTSGSQVDFEPTLALEHVDDEQQ